MNKFIAVILVVGILVCAVAQEPPMALPPQEQLGYSTVRIECTLADGSSSRGTGFFFRCADNKEKNSHIPVIVTNKHVITGAVKGRFLLHVADEHGNPVEGKSRVIELANFEKRWIPHPDPAVDLCVLPIAPLVNEAAAQKIKLFYIALDASLLARDSDMAELSQFQRVMMVGYPIGIWDSANNMPIFRSGVTATHPRMNYEGRREFMIDAACFPGSSGSPVLLFDMGNYVTKDGNTVIGSRIKLLGVLYAGPQFTATGEIITVTIPTKDVSLALSRIPSNLGNVIKATALLDFDKVFVP